MTARKQSRPGCPEPAGAIGVGRRRRNSLSAAVTTIDIVTTVRREGTFQASGEFAPAGDQPQAIERLAEGVVRGDRHQTLLGVTGTGKTFTIANTIAKVNKPTLVIAPNKSLAAQLANEFREI